MKKTFFTAAFALLVGLLLSLVPMEAQAQCTMCKSQVEAARQERDDLVSRGIVADRERELARLRETGEPGFRASCT